MPFLTIGGRTVYRDPTFARGVHPPAAPVPEAGRYLDPAFRNLSPAPEPARAPFLRWLLDDDDDPAFVRRATAAYGQGRILLGRAISESVDDLGDTILMRGVPLRTDVKVHHKHYEGINLGQGRLFRRQSDAIAAIVLPDNLGGHTLVSEVATGRLPYLSVGGTVKGRMGKTITRFLPTDVSLTDSPADRSCCVMPVSDRHFDEFARDVLGLKGVLPWL